MSITFHCECGKKIVVGEKHAGRSGKCPDCGKIVKVPDSGSLDVSPMGETSTCMGCGEPIPGGDVICLLCGYNQITGEIVHTQVGGSSAAGKLEKLSQKQRDHIAAEMPLWVTRAIKRAAIIGILVAIAGCLSLLISTESGLWSQVLKGFFWVGVIVAPITGAAAIIVGIYALMKGALQKEAYWSIIGGAAAVVLWCVMLWLPASGIGVTYERKGKEIIGDFPALAKVQESTDRDFEKELKRMNKDKKVKSYSITHSSMAPCENLTLTEAEEKYGAPEKKEPPGEDEFPKEDIDIIWWYWRVGLAANPNGNVVRLIYRRHAEKGKK